MRESLSPVSNVSKEEVTGRPDCTFSGNLRVASMIFSKSQGNLVSFAADLRALCRESSFDWTSIESDIYHIVRHCEIINDDSHISCTLSFTPGRIA
jgi:hypothetical protein